MGYKIMDSLAEGVFLLRVSDSTIVYVNKRFEAMFGYESGELIGKNVSVLNAPTDKSPEETAEMILDALNRHNAWRGEIHNIKRDGTPFWCYASVVSLMHPDYGNVWVSIHTDITEQKKQEDQLKAKLEEILKLNSLMFGREKRNIELKREVDGALKKAGEPPRYNA